MQKTFKKIKDKIKKREVSFSNKDKAAFNEFSEIIDKLSEEEQEVAKKTIQRIFVLGVEFGEEKEPNSSSNFTPKNYRSC